MRLGCTCTAPGSDSPGNRSHAIVISLKFQNLSLRGPVAMPSYASFMENLPVYAFARVARKSQEVAQRDGVAVINARIGIPDKEAMPTVKRHMEEAVREADSTLGYPVDMHPERGIAALREAIQADYKERHGVDVPDECIMVTGWSKEVLHNLPRMFRGNAVIPEPVYPAYVGAAIAAGNPIRLVPMSAEGGWLPEVKLQSDDAYMFFCDPNNPTGSVADRPYYDGLAGQLKATDTIGIFDKPYKDYVFDASVKPLSIAQIPGMMDHGYEVVSFSKHHNFVGIGLGWLVSSPENISQFNRFYGHIWQGVPLYHQKAGLVALTDPAARAEMKAYMDELTDRRRLFVDGLNQLGLRCDTAPATPYLWIKVPEGRNDEDFVLETILGRAHVAFMPGSYFGQSGSGYMRATLFLPEEKINEALGRIAAVRDW
ncbi:MAG: pyridoxal phosphate-dependent aminotransferase [Chloroflexi bacterium]|nr:pyridoxal phosphate-dependent aminotransferase [Chloroflexota bacterium]